MKIIAGMSLLAGVVCLFSEAGCVQFVGGIFFISLSLMLFADTRKAK